METGATMKTNQSDDIESELFEQRLPNHGRHQPKHLKQPTNQPNI